MTGRTSGLVRYALAVCLLAFPLTACVMAFSWGHFSLFFHHPARVAAALVFAASQTAVILFTSGFRAGVRFSEDDLPWRLVMNVYGPVLFALLPLLDGRSVLPLPGAPTLRLASLALLAAGLVLRVGPMLELGQRFSGRVAIQQDHQLETSGFYRFARHPSYLGVLLTHGGFACAFPTWPALAFTPLLAWLLWRRAEREEQLLVEAFGQAYREYAARTPRLFPGWR